MLVAALLVTSCSRISERTWATGAEYDAEWTGVRIVPASATDIRHARDNNMGRQWLRFRLPGPSAGPLLQEFRRVPENGVTFPESPWGIHWWPSNLGGEHRAGDSVYHFYCREAGRSRLDFLAIEEGQLDTVYWWPVNSEARCFAD